MSSRIAGRAENLQLEPLNWKRLGPAPADLPSKPDSAKTAPDQARGTVADPRIGELEKALAAVKEQAEQRVRAAQQEAFDKGLRQGVQQGEQKAVEQVEPLMKRLLRTVEDLAGTRDAFRREAEEDLVRLSLGVARRILNRELSIDPDALLGVVRVALGKFDARELHRVRVATADEATIRAGIESLRLARRIEIIGDPGLERGALLFETVKGTLDASIETQLEEIERGFLDLLGKKHG